MGSTDGCEAHAVRSGISRGGRRCLFSGVVRTNMAIHREKTDRVFENAYEEWLRRHMERRTGERRKRLAEGLGYLEKLFLSDVWWPSFGNLRDLHPEFEVSDFKDGTRFLDFAYVAGSLRMCMELDAFGTHHRDIDRWQHSDHLDRQNDLLIDGWKLLRFSLVKIKQNPRHCQQKLQQALGRWGGGKTAVSLDDPIDQAILRFMETQGKDLSPTFIARELGWNHSTTAKHLRSLHQRNYVIPLKSGTKRVSRYLLNLNGLPDSTKR
jgi:hypothetical protein